MEKENNQIEQQTFNVEVEVNEKKIEISEKSDRLMKRSIIYLQIGFWTVVGEASVFSLALMSFLLGGGSKWIGAFLVLLLLMGGVFAFWLTKMYAYIGDYKIFRKTKTQQALEDLLDAQKGYYGWIYLFPLIIIALSPFIALIAFVLGDL